MKHIAHLMRASLLILLGTLLFAPHTLQPVFAPFAPSPDVAMYTQNSLAMLTAQHLILVFSSLLISVVFGVGAGVFATRPSGRPFLPLSRAIANIGQTFAHGLHNIQTELLVQVNRDMWVRNEKFSQHTRQQFRYSCCICIQTNMATHPLRKRLHILLQMCNFISL